MAMDDADKWASQLLNELLEKLAEVDRVIVPHTETTKSKRQDISKVISKVITKSTSSRENHISGSALKYEEGFDILSQPGETREVKFEVFDKGFKEKIKNFEDGDDGSRDLQKVDACDRISAKNHSASEKRAMSHHKPAESVKTNNKEDIETEKKNNPILDNSVVTIYDSWELKNKDSLLYNCEDFPRKNLKTDITDRECFQLRDDSHINSIDEINSGILTKNFKSEEILLQNTEQIEKNACRTGSGNRNDEDFKGIGQCNSHNASRSEHTGEKCIEEEIEYCRYAEGENSTKSSSGIKIGNMPANLYKEKYVKTGNVKIKIETQGDACSNIKIENEKLDKQGDIINHQVEDIDPKMILAERNIRNALEESEENYENIYCDTKSEDKNNFDLKSFKKITDLVPLTETIAFGLAVDLTTDIDLIAHLQTNNRIPHYLKDVSPRLDSTDDPIIAQRHFKVISVYRNACRAFEDLVLSPSAMFIAESIDIMKFGLFLSVSVFYMLYKEMNTKFNSFWNTKNSLKDQFKGENWKNFKANNFLNINEIYYDLSETDPLSSFSSDEDDEETLEHKNEIYVAPEKVNVLSNVREYAKQTLDDLYEKGGEYLENLCNKHATAIVKSHEDISVDIILKDSEIQSSKGDQTKIKDASVCPVDLDQEIEKPLDEIRKCSKNNYWKFITFSNDAKDISDDISESICLSDVSLSDHNVPHLMEFPVIFDKQNIFNSTEIDDLVFETRSRRASKALSPSEINIFDNLCSSCKSPGIICDNGLRNSSLSVNAASFSSISSLNIRSRSFSSTRSLFNMENSDRSFQEGTDPIRMGQDSDIKTVSNKKVADSLKNQTQSDELSFNEEPTSPEKTMGPIQPGELPVEDAGEGCGSKTPESLSVNVESASKHSDFFGHLSAVDAEEEQIRHAHGEDSLIYDCPQSLPYSGSSDHTYNEISFVDSDEATASDTRVLKDKSSRKLRRRMSGIFHNLRAVGLMQCVMSSAKRQKKFKKQTNGPDA